MIKTLKACATLIFGNYGFSKRFNDKLRRYYSDSIGPGMLKGINYLKDARLNKGLAFSLEERQMLGIHGLLPARMKSQEEQIDLCKLALSRYKEPLNKYIYLGGLHERNERTFFRLLSENLEELLPIVYTPTVGQACQKFGLLYEKPKGLFITINDKGHVSDVLKNWPETNVRMVCVTDGQRILGLGDLAASGMGIVVGKLGLCTALAGIKPNLCLPVTLDVGTNTEALLQDPSYVGLQQKRVTGPVYDEFVDEFMQALVKRYGQQIVVQFEDFGNENAFKMLDKYKRKYCTFNDDIQGTGAVTVSGFLTAEKLTGRPMGDNTYLFFGAGEAAVGIADQMVRFLELKGMNPKEACKKVWMFDIDGLLTTSRPKEDLDIRRVRYAKNVPHTKNLLEVIERVKPTFLIGSSTVGGSFTPEVLKKMGEINERPGIFALSNPNSKSECTPELAYKSTEGRAIVATGSPFPPVNFGGRTFRPSQANNAYVYPGIALGAIESRIRHIDEDLFLVASETICDYVTKEDLQAGSLYPPLSKIKAISVCLASRMLQYTYDIGSAAIYPEPQDKKAYIESRLYDYHYQHSLPVRWETVSKGSTL